MPKKRAPLQYTKPTSPAHPSLSATTSRNGLHSPNLSGPGAEKSVNQLIQDLRISQAHATPKERFQGPLNPQTVHPSLKSILQIPDTPPPRPRPGVRGAGGRHGRIPAGPPPPISWLNDSMHEITHSRQGKRTTADTQARRERGHQLGALPDQYFPDERSLIHQTLKALAKGWEWHVEYDQYYLATLPVRYKQALLSYIAFYGPESITCRSLEVLFFDDSQLKDATGSENVTHLDVATSIGHPLGLREFKDFLIKKRPILFKATPTTENDSVPETWDLPPPTSFPAISRFPSLTHLSLAHPSSASWRSLLALSAHLPTLTHLSIAHWPVPSLAPNSKTAFRTSPRGDVDYGGSNHYSLYDCDFSEAGGVLRRLCRALLCLKWLDLTGCGEWIRALGVENGVDWNGAWRGVEIVQVGSGWVPEYIKDGSGRWKELWTDAGLEYWSSEKLALRRELKIWVECEKNVRAVEQEVAHIIAQGARPNMDMGDIIAEDPATRLPGTWWEYGSGSKAVQGAKAGQRACRVKFERGWEGWWIEDAVREMTKRGRVIER